MSRVIDLAGQTYGRLTVLSRSPRSGRAYWNCICECGGSASVLGKSLRRGDTRSCGCIQKETIAKRNFRHGLGAERSKEYRCWLHIKGRCLNPANAAFHNYGARGITVSVLWKNDFEVFLRDVGYAPSPDMTLERIDNDKGYEPGNVVWADRKTQNRNTRRNVFVVLNGERIILKDACACIGADYKRVAHQMRNGLSFDNAVSKVEKFRNDKAR